MSTPEEDKITMNLKLLTFAMAVIISVIGFFITRTLSSIDANIVELKIQLEKRGEMIQSHETRLGVHEYKINNIEKEIKEKRGN